MENNLVAKITKFLREIPNSKTEIREISSYNKKSFAEFWSIFLTDYSPENQLENVAKNNSENEILFAIFEKSRNPARINLRCDTNLAKLLCEKYESASKPENLSSQRWIAILLTGQIPKEEMRDLIYHAASQAKKDCLKSCEIFWRDFPAKFS